MMTAHHPGCDRSWPRLVVRHSSPSALSRAAARHARQARAIENQLGDNEFFKHLLAFGKIRQEHDRIYYTSVFPHKLGANEIPLEGQSAEVSDQIQTVEMMRTPPPP